MIMEPKLKTLEVKNSFEANTSEHVPSVTGVKPF